MRLHIHKFLIHHNMKAMLRNKLYSVNVYLKNVEYVCWHFLFANSNGVKLISKIKKIGGFGAQGKQNKYRKCIKVEIYLLQAKYVNIGIVRVKLSLVRPSIYEEFIQQRAALLSFIIFLWWGIYDFRLFLLLTFFLTLLVISQCFIYYINTVLYPIFIY